MELLIGMVGALLGIAMFCIGFKYGNDYGHPKKTEAVEASEEYAAALKEAKEQIQKEQAAFVNLMQYNSEMAYGLAQNKQE